MELLTSLFTTLYSGSGIICILQRLAVALCTILMIYMCNIIRNKYQSSGLCAPEKPDDVPQTYTACSSPHCVRCFKYQMIRREAKSKITAFGGTKTGAQRLLKSFCDHSFALDTQKPNVFYVQDLLAQPWWMESHFTCFKQDVHTLESNYSDILQELNHAVKSVDCSDSGWTTNIVPNGTWSTFYFYNQGIRVNKNCEKCPRTSSVIAGLAGRLSSCVFGNALFSVMAPGTEITEHYGPTNVRIRCHLGLTVPEGCRLTVDHKPQPWQRGKCLLFDDSFLHKASHTGEIRAGNNRSILMVDFWHPQLTETEKELMIHAFGIED